MKTVYQHLHQVTKSQFLLTSSGLAILHCCKLQTQQT